MVNRKKGKGMGRARSISANEKGLIKRYLLWCYKTTKEEIDKVDRKFTQIIVDDVLLKELESMNPPNEKSVRDAYLMKLGDFRKYKDEKKQAAQKEKYLDPQNKTLLPQYHYLKNRLKAVEKAICLFLSEAELKKIKVLYEEEMVRRILAAREHH
jgi:hypothetical protein